MAGIAGRRRQGFAAGGPGGGNAAPSQERVRTHLFFGGQSEHTQMKRKRRTHNKLHQQLPSHRKDEVAVQTGDLDPSDWTGNQRVIHFGPMAQRDPFFYYYPKGWDILYPACFGFFPYRTTKFRGSSPIVCLAAFGLFFVLGGALMCYLGYVVLHSTPFWNWPDDQKLFLPPIQIAGPAFMIFGCVLLLLGMCWWLTTLRLCKEKMRHTQPHEPLRSRRIYQHKQAAMDMWTTSQQQPPYHPLPPPAYPVLANAYTEPTVFSPQAELKLYPPVMPGQSTLSLHGVVGVYGGGAYNTLQAPPASRYHPSFDDGAAKSQHRDSADSMTGEQQQRRRLSKRASVASSGAGSAAGYHRQQQYHRRHRSSHAGFTEASAAHRSRSLGAGSQSSQRRPQQRRPQQRQQHKRSKEEYYHY